MNQDGGADGGAGVEEGGVGGVVGAGGVEGGAEVGVQGVQTADQTMEAGQQVAGKSTRISDNCETEDVAESKKPKLMENSEENRKSGSNEDERVDDKSSNVAEADDQQDKLSVVEQVVEDSESAKKDGSIKHLVSVLLQRAKSNKMETKVV